MKKFALIVAAGFIINAITSTALLFPEGNDIKLEKPVSNLNVDLISALENRKSTRNFSAKPVSPEDLSTILWAANGINRSDGKRTAPAPMGIYLIQIYVASSTGTYFYDPSKGVLKFISDKNIKGMVGRQADIPHASYVLILTAKLDMLPSRVNNESKIAMANATAGCIAQNVYLTAAALGIGTRIVAGMNIEGITGELKLVSDEVPLYIMPLGYPQ